MSAQVLRRRRAVWARIDPALAIDNERNAVND